MLNIGPENPCPGMVNPRHAYAEKVLAMPSSPKMASEKNGGHIGDAIHSEALNP